MKAFVIMPFAKEFDDIFQLGIKDTAKNRGVRAYRLDEELFDQGMLEKIYSEIDDCDFLIADLSDKNPNVFYELGYAHAKNKLCILITQEIENIPFDLKHKRHIVYGNSIKHLKAELDKNILWAIEEIQKKKNNPFQLELKATGSLDNTDQYSKAIVEFKVDIENITNKTSPEIHSIYMHTSQEWNVKKDDKVLSFKTSDVKNYKYKYQFQPDMIKVPKKGWTQIKLNLSRIIARKWMNEEIKDSYTINGNIYFELITDNEVFEYRFPLSVYVDNLPF